MTYKKTFVRNRIRENGICVREILLLIVVFKYVFRQENIHLKRRNNDLKNAYNEVQEKYDQVIFFFSLNKVVILLISHIHNSSLNLFPFIRFGDC